MEKEICVMDSGLDGYETDGAGKGRLADSDGNVEQKMNLLDNGLDSISLLW